MLPSINVMSQVKIATTPVLTSGSTIRIMPFHNLPLANSTPRNTKTGSQYLITHDHVTASEKSDVSLG